MKKILLFMVMGASALVFSAFAAEAILDTQEEKTILASKPDKLPIIKKDMLKMEGKVADQLKVKPGGDGQMPTDSYHDDTYGMTVREVIRYAKRQYDHEEQSPKLFASLDHPVSMKRTTRFLSVM
jgi:hypothetical protein